MKKTKIIAILTAFVILTAMTGIAAAAPESIVPDSYYNNLPNDGTPVSVQLTMTGFDSAWTANTIHTISAATTTATAGGSLNDLEYRFTHGSDSSAWLTTGTPWQWTDGATGTEVVTLDIRTTGNPPVDVDYNIYIYDTYDLGAGEVDVGSCTIFGNSIPEFATIAIPAVAILGLFLFFNHRKRKEK